MVTDFIGEPSPQVTLGPRVRADIKRRIHELECRHPRALTSLDKRELSRLRELLNLAEKGGLADE